MVNAVLQYSSCFSFTACVHESACQGTDQVAIPRVNTE